LAAPVSDLALQDAGKVFKGNCVARKDKGIYRTDLTIALVSGRLSIQSLNQQEEEDEEETGCEGTDWIGMAQNKAQLWILVNMVMNL
jgi:hypothetical protein